MATNIILKKSAIADKAPLAGDLAYGEIALNYADGYVYYKDTGNVVKTLSADWDNLTHNPATTAGLNLYTVTDPDAETFLRINADNTVSTLSNDEFRASIGTETSTTGSAVIPAGTEAERDAAPVNGYLRYNSDAPTFEGYVADEWVPIATAKEFTYTSPDLGEYVIDTIAKADVRSVSYEIQMSAYGGYHTSELRIVHNGDTAYIVEYAKVITNDNLGSFDAVINGDNIELKCDFIFPETIAVFRRTVISNSGDTFIGNDFNSGTGVIDLNQGSGTIELNTDLGA